MGICTKFLKSSSGNVAITFGLALVPLLLAAGAAVDYSRQSMADSSLQAAVDAATLAAATQTNPTDAILKAEVTKFLKANGADALVPAISSVNITQPDDATLRVEAAGQIESSIMRIAGYETLDFSASAEVKRTIGKLEVALVLDNTGSMSGTKINTLKTAASDLVDTLFAGPNADKNVKVAVVPFAEYVNVGTGNRNAAWIDVPANSSSTTNQCWDTYPDAQKSNCRMETFTGYNDNVPYSYQAEVCDWNYGTPVQQCGPVTTNSEWYGCVGSRDYPLNVVDSDPAVRYPGVMDVGCTAQLMELSNNKSAVKSSINSLTATGNTYIPAGLIWGWNALSPAEPLTGAAPYTELSKGLKKAVVLMTDGQNTISPTYPKHDGHDTALSNQLTAEICQNAKSMGLIIYTIAFQVSDTTTENMLKACASDTTKYFDADNGALLTSAFEEIGKSLAQLYISR